VAPWRYRWAAAAGSSPSPPAETQFEVTTVVRAMSGSVKTSRSSRCLATSRLQHLRGRYPSAMDKPIRYAVHEGVHIAYEVVGDGPIDLVYTPGDPIEPRDHVGVARMVALPQPARVILEADPVRQ
jgi:hypothetical protein